jgi:hypothetical protein
LHRLVSMVRLLPTHLAASATASTARGARSVVAATAPAEPALLRVYRVAAPAASTMTAVAGSASMASVMSHVQLIGSCSATAPAQRSARRGQSAPPVGFRLRVVRKALHPVLVQATAVAQVAARTSVQPTSTVLSGSFVLCHPQLGDFVNLRARGSASHSLSAI